MVRSIKYLRLLNKTNENKDVKKSASKILVLLENVFRSCLVIFTFLLAISIPKIGKINSSFFLNDLFPLVFSFLSWFHLLALFVG